MCKKITFIGAGSLGFTRNLVRDLLTFPSFQDAHIFLMDIDEERLNYSKLMVEKIVKAGNYPAKVFATLNRQEALDGADAVIITILVGGVQIWRHDIEIPKKYGVDINVGDTRGPAGIFRALRTIPVMIDIAKDIEKHCPEAIVLNYTNPMAMLIRAVQTVSKIKIVGLCHSVQGTAEMLARWIGAPMNEITYFCAGINHQAWFLKYEWKGKDAYPLIREAILTRPEIYKEEIVRNEMFLQLGYYVTESSGHNSEYNPWFRKRQDLIEKYCLPGTGWNPGEWGYILKEYLKRENTWRKEVKEWIEKEPINLERGHEYAAYILNAILGDGTIFEFNGNIRNFGLIDNLPYGACVEVPIIASKRGFDSIKVGNLPPQVAILNYINSSCEELAVEGSLEGDPKKIFYAIAYDPLTSAVLSLAEIKQMVKEMFEINKDYLPQFKNFEI
uniref:Alpha-galactosidase n=1 Tax=Dictyoglomus thermophilum TaxID=14 RepID=A0A7C3RJG3_DICTH